jgi:uncharacterized damage-inducible protein DinB
MTAGISLQELLVWNGESSNVWKAHLDANPELLKLPCTIGGAKDVQEFVRHVWRVELRWSCRLAGLLVPAKEELPTGPLEALFGMHREAEEVFRGLLAASEESWNEPFVLDLERIPALAHTLSRRKVMAHALLHGQRHWAQLATLVREAGFPSGFRGDFLFSSALA